MDDLVFLPLSQIPDESGISSISLLLAFYFSGSVVMLGLSIWRYLRIRSVTTGAVMMKQGPVKVYVHRGRRGSFTLFRRIYLDQHSWGQKAGHVFRHEMVHASQLHSADLIFMTFVGVLLWFNPFVFLLLRHVRENHEYLADEHARTGPDALAAYLVCLRQETIRRYSPAVASYFKSSTIKKRIIMLTNNHTKSQKRWRYLAILPVVTLILLAFQTPADPVVQAPVKVLESIPGLSMKVSVGEIPSIFPLPEQYRQKLSRGYGPGIHPLSKEEMFHRGVDIAAPGGTPVYATAAGTVQDADFHKAWGKYLILEHDQGYSTRYTHLEDHNVKTGERISKGQEVARVGSTGRSTGPHLHYEVWKDGEHRDPADFY